jgi:hypothetical protein
MLAFGKLAFSKTESGNMTYVKRAFLKVKNSTLMAF